MKPTRLLASFTLALTVLVGCSTPPTMFPTSTPAHTRPASPTPTPAPRLVSSPVEPSATPLDPTVTADDPTAVPVNPTATPSNPYALVSQEQLFAYLEDLTAIQPYSGWRNSATVGETEGLDYVAERLDELAYLRSLGMVLEQQRFSVFMATELWETRLHLTVDGQEIEVPADGLRGDRDRVAQALRFDSDGMLNDSERNPVVVAGEVVLVESSGDIAALTTADIRGKVVLLDYAVIDRALQDTGIAVKLVSELVVGRPAGLVLVTRFSNRPDESHGAFVGDVSALNWVEAEPAPPTLYVRLEDLAPAGIETWEGLERIESIRLTWDADVFSPGDSGNLVARIPGIDGSGAVILGAHIDSPNSPGAMDNGSGSVVLLEVARALNAAQVQPATDLYLVWFGSEELGAYGSAHFAATHQELLDRTLAMLNVDCLTYPLDGIRAELDVTTWSYGRFGDRSLGWPDFLSGTAEQLGVETRPENYYGVQSDNGVFAGFGVPNANLIYSSPQMDASGSFHNSGHIHDPYDTVELAREVGDVLEDMARVALAAALEGGQQAHPFRIAPPPTRRALFVASHTEELHMGPTAFTELGMALAMEGFDVDLLPYGHPVTPADLRDADLVVALPVVDYPSMEGDLNLYDEAWGQKEVDALEKHVSDGGLLVLTNSARRFRLFNRVLDFNEDWSDVNTLAERFGVSYKSERPPTTVARAEGEHPLMEGVSVLQMVEDNGVVFELANGQVLAQANGKPIIGLVDHGEAGGQVLVLADLSLFGHGWTDPLDFWKNLALYARSR